MLKISFHKNGNLESFEVSWKFILGMLSLIGVFISGLFSALSKLLLIISITIQGLISDPDSFKAKLIFQ